VPRAAGEIEQPAAENCTNNAEQDVDDGSLARRANHLAQDQAQHEPTRSSTQGIPDREHKKIR
jgi:hypothetical protein